MLDTNDEHYVNMELLIVEGLFNLKERELTNESSTGYPIENALSFNWGRNVLSMFGNAFLQFQAPSTKGNVDFYVNGFCDCAVEVIRNATQTVSDDAKPGSLDIDAHLNRFLKGQYPWKRFVLFNFAMNGFHGDMPVLPKALGYHSYVYSYDHKNNRLYRGSKIIRAPAVTSLPCPVPSVPYAKPLSLAHLSRGFCTWNRAAMTVLYVPKPVLPFTRKSLCSLLKLCK